jgi:hypothetical protein
MLDAPLFEIYGCTESGQLATRRSTKTQHWTTFEGAIVKQINGQSYAYGTYIEGDVLLSDNLELHSSTEFTLQGRHADMVNIAGKRSSLGYLNQQLLSIEGVVDGVFVYPQVDLPDAVQRLSVCVVAPALDKTALIQALRVRVDAVFLPRQIYFVAQLPRNTTGKLVASTLASFLRTLEASKLGIVRPNTNGEIKVRIPKHHPSFAGHFPGAPILPGVVSLDWVLTAVFKALGRFDSPKRISAVKFLAPFLPDEELTVRYKISQDKVNIEVFNGDLKAASISAIIEIL